MHTKYKAFLAALAFELVTGVLIYLTPPRRNLRAELFFVSTAIGWVFRFLVLRELCLLVFNDHPGIKAADGIGIRVSLALAIVIPLATLALARYREMVYPILETFFLFHQSATFFLTVLFAGTVAFVAWFPIALRRNIVLYCLGFSIKFFGESALLLFRNATISTEWRRAANMVDMIIGLTAVLLWLVWLNSAGEAPLVSVGQLLRPGQTRQALLHLDRINRFLSATLRNSRKHKYDLNK